MQSTVTDTLPGGVCRCSKVPDPIPYETHAKDLLDVGPPSGVYAQHGSYQGFEVPRVARGEWRTLSCPDLQQTRYM